MPMQEGVWTSPSSSKTWLSVRSDPKHDTFEKRIIFYRLTGDNREDAAEAFAAEILIRYYLYRAKTDSFTCTFKEVRQRPEDKPNIVRDFLDENCPDCETIRQNFESLKYDLQNKLIEAKAADLESVTIVMEYGDANVGDSIHTLANARKFQEHETMTLLQNLFSLLCDAKSVYLLLLDLKPDNLLQTDRNLRKTWILNDFDHSYLMKNANQAEYLPNEPGWLSVKYAAPEQIFQESLSYQTDVFAACLIAYQLLNGSLPEGLDSGDAKQRQAVFEEIARGEREIKAPLHGSDQLKKVVCKAIVVINYQDHSRSPFLYLLVSQASFIAFTTALALFTHSSNSFSGTESATSPAPLLTNTLPFFL